jgi:hypothetical protein
MVVEPGRTLRLESAVELGFCAVSTIRLETLCILLEGTEILSMLLTPAVKL